MKKVSDIIALKAKELGSNVKLAIALGADPKGKNIGAKIGQYINDVINPPLSFAIEWKKAFNENLIDLMFAEEAPTQVLEQEQPYGKYTQALEDLNECNKENKKLQAEIERLKNFGHHVGSKL